MLPFPSNLRDEPRISIPFPSNLVDVPHNDNLLYCNNNPEGDPCDICKPDIGRVFIPGTEPYVPRHDNCYCYYVPTRRQPSPARARPR